MTEQERIILIETEQRSKTNTHRLDDMSADVKEIKSEQKTLYTLAESIKNLVEKVTRIEGKVDDLQGEMTQVKNEPNKETATRFRNLTWGFLGVIGGGIITAVLNLILK